MDRTDAADTTVGRAGGTGGTGRDEAPTRAGSRNDLSRGWTAPRFFDLLNDLGRLRVISVCGPSVFEAICEAGPYEIVGGFLNMITDAYHWHFAMKRFGHLRSFDTTHARSGRRILYFELREQPEDDPFLRIYAYRPPETDFEPAVLERFAEAHRELAEGVSLEPAEVA
mgnify:CR=1 FL=1